MTRLIRSIAAVFVADVEKTAYRFSRGMGPRPAPTTRHR
jgi:hypothetical protein